MVEIYHIGKPETDGKMKSPGLNIELTNDKSLIEFKHYFYPEGDFADVEEDEVTQIVGIKPDEIDKVIDALKDIKTKLNKQGV